MNKSHDETWKSNGKQFTCCFSGSIENTTQYFSLLLFFFIRTEFTIDKFIWFAHQCHAYHTIHGEFAIQDLNNYKKIPKWANPSSNATRRVRSTTCRSRLHINKLYKYIKMDEMQWYTKNNTWHMSCSFNQKSRVPRQEIPQRHPKNCAENIQPYKVTKTIYIN